MGKWTLALLGVTLTVAAATAQTTVTTSGTTTTGTVPVFGPSSHTTVTNSPITVSGSSIQVGGTTTATGFTDTGAEASSGMQFCLQINSSGSISNTGAACGTGSSLTGSPTSGQYWGYNGTTQGWFTPTAAASPGGTANSLQFNKSGVQAGAPSWLYDPTLDLHCYFLPIATCESLSTAPWGGAGLSGDIFYPKYDPPFIVGDPNTDVGAGMFFGTTEGTVASPSAVLQNDPLGILAFFGYDGSHYTSGLGDNGAVIGAFVDDAVSNGSVPTLFVFSGETQNYFEAHWTNSAKTYNGIELDIWDNGHAANSSALWLYNQTTATDLFSVDPSGNVGIAGTLNVGASSQFRVSTAGAVTASSFSGSGAGLTGIPYSAITGSPAGSVISVFGRAGAVTAASGDYSVNQVTGAAPLASPTFSGNVGIGTSSLGGTLDVEGGTAAASTNGAAILFASQNAGTGGNNNGGDVDITTGTGFGSGNGGNFNLTLGAGGSSGYEGYASFYQSSNPERSLVIMPGLTSFSELPANYAGISITTQETSYPFNLNGNLVISSRNETSDGRDIVLATMSGGSTLTPDLVVSGSTGMVGIGATVPGSALDVLASGGKDVLLGGGSSTGSEIKFLYGGQSHYSIYNDGNRSLTIADTSSSGLTNTAGTVLVSFLSNGSAGGLVQVNGGLTFTGQSGTQTTPWTGVLCGGDYAEAVDPAGDMHSYGPGDVLVITDGQGGNGDVRKSAEPYSTMVAGIYATKPGVVGRRESLPKDAQDLPMAMVGIVPTKVTAENGPIHRGDLLVTSSVAGYAMKGTDRSKMLGAVIGKAMGNLDSGAGTIEVLVTLQ